MAINKKLIYYNRTLANFKSDANGLNGQTTASGGNVGNIPYASIVFTSDGYIWTHGKEFNCNNTWRGIQNNLTSTSTTDSLSAYQGKILNEKFANYLPLSGGTLTGVLTVPSLTVSGSSTFSQAINASILGNAATASRLLNARTITVGSTSKSFDGSGNISFTLSEIGALASGSYVTIGSDQTITATKTFKTAVFGTQITVHRDRDSKPAVIKYSNNTETLGYLGIGQDKIPKYWDASTNPYALAYSGNVGTGDNNGQVKIAGTNVSVKGLGSNAFNSTSYLPTAGGKMTGAIKRYYSDASNDPMIALSSNNQDVWLWRVNHSASDATVSVSGVYGFGLKYLGTGDGNANDLILYADNQSGTQVEVYRVHQDGLFIFKATPKVGTASVMLSTHAANEVTTTKISNWDTVYDWYSVAANSDGTDDAINKWKEVEAFLTGITDTQTLTGLLASRVAKSGDTMTGALTTPGLTVTGASTFNQAINGSILGNAATASRLENARTISLTGSVTGSGSFDGSGNLSIATTTNHTHAYFPYQYIWGDSLTSAVNLNTITDSLKFVTVSWSYSGYLNVTNSPWSSSAGNVFHLGGQYPMQIASFYNTSTDVYIRTYYSGNGWKDWKKIAFAGEALPASDVYAWAKESTKPSYTASEVGALKNYGNTNSRPNSTTFTLPGGANAVSMRSGATSGADIGIFYLSDDNAFVCNSSDNAYLFAAFDTDKTADFSAASNAAFAVLSNHEGVSMKGNLTVAGTITSGGTAVSLSGHNHDSRYVMLTGDQTILGNKIFSGSTSLDDTTIGNIVVTGGASFALTINGNAATANKVNHTLTFTGYSTGTFDGSADKSIAIPSNTNQLTNGAGFITASSNITGTAAGITGYTFKTNTSKSTSGWTNNTTDDKIIPTMSFIAYWNGAYSGTSSNLTYCNQGAFGTATTHAHTDYVTSITYDSTNKKLQLSKGGGTATDIVTFGSHAFDSTVYIPASGANYNTNTDANPFKISRNGGNDETLAISVNDSRTLFKYTNDEYSNSIVFQLINTDTENSDGSRASDRNVTISSSNSGISMTIGGSNVWHAGNLTTTAAASGGTTAALVTTGDKYKWNLVYDWLTTTTADTDTTINKWKELEAFLSSVTESDTLSGLLANRVAKSGDTMTGALTTPGLTVTGAATFSLAINGSILGNAATASRLLNTRTISFTGAFTGNYTFDGSADISINTSHSHSYLPVAQVSEEQNTNATWGKTYAESHRQSFVYNTSGREWAYWIGMRSSDTQYGTILRLSHDGLVQYAHKAGGGAGANWSAWKDIITSDNIGNLSVNYATSAGSASSATSADSATKDGSGNTITDTYLPLTSSTTKALTNTVSGWGWTFLNGNTNSIMYVAHNGGYGMHLRGYTTSAGVYLMQLYNNTAELFSVYANGRVYAAGNVGIGSTSPSYKLHVVGSTYSSSDIIAGGDIRVSGNDFYIGSASGSQCHQQYDPTNKVLKFLFD